MSGICGLVNLDGAPVADEHVRRMADAMCHWGPDGGRTLTAGGGGFAQLIAFDTPESTYEALPTLIGGGALFTAAARLDNRDELCDIFGLSTGARLEVADTDLIGRAYQKWGDASPEHLSGDWAFAVWRPAERRLLLARDHHGRTSLYYSRVGDQFAFASDRRALLALSWVRPRLNEVQLALTLSAFPVFDPVETTMEGVLRLPPAHALVATDRTVRTWRHWALDRIALDTQTSTEGLAEALAGTLAAAVKTRLRSRRPVCSQLSAGLDSGAVTCLAASALAEHGRPLVALTAVPLFAHGWTAGPGRIGNEWPLASVVAASASNIEHVAVDAADVGPLDGVRRGLEILGEPSFGAAGFFWGLAVYGEARRRGMGTLLDGQAGNFAMSFDTRSAAERNRSLIKLARLVRRHWGFFRTYRTLSRSSRSSAWLEYSPLQRSFAERIGLVDRLIAAGHALEPTGGRGSDRETRLRTLRFGTSIFPGVLAEIGASCGLALLDPTADRRLIELVFSIPGERLAGPMPRWFFRQAMAGILPDPVRLATRRGLQTVDIVQRVQHQQAEVASALRDLRSVPQVAEFIDIARMDSVFARAGRRQSSGRDAALSRSVLLRGIGAGWFLAEPSKFGVSPR